MPTRQQGPGGALPALGDLVATRLDDASGAFRSVATRVWAHAESNGRFWGRRRTAGRRPGGGRGGAAGAAGRAAGSQERAPAEVRSAPQRRSSADTALAVSLSLGALHHLPTRTARVCGPRLYFSHSAGLGHDCHTEARESVGMTRSLVGGWLGSPPPAASSSVSTALDWVPKVVRPNSMRSSRRRSPDRAPGRSGGRGLVGARAGSDGSPHAGSCQDQVVELLVPRPARNCSPASSGDPPACHSGATGRRHRAQVGGPRGSTEPRAEGTRSAREVR